MRFLIVIPCVLAFFLCGCELYKNNDRNRFEQAVPGKLVASRDAQYLIIPESCYIQSVHIPIVSNSAQNFIHKINENEIEVCDASLTENIPN